MGALGVRAEGGTPHDEADGGDPRHSPVAGAAHWAGEAVAMNGPTNEFWEMAGAALLIIGMGLGLGLMMWLSQ